MKAVLLAAGRGTRLAPLTDSTPKVLAPLAGRPLLAHQLEYLQAGGVEEVAINVHHRAGQVIAALEQLRPAIAVRISHEHELLGTAGALLPLRDFIDEPTIVLYGDVVTDAPLEGLMAEHRQQQPLATLAVHRCEQTAGKGIVRLANREGRIAAFEEKPAQAPPQALVSAGLYVIAPALPQLIEQTPCDFGADLWPAALSRGHVLRAYALDCYVRDIGSPAALQAAAEDVQAGAPAW